MFWPMWVWMVWAWKGYEYSHFPDQVPEQSGDRDENQTHPEYTTTKHLRILQRKEIVMINK